MRLFIFIVSAALFIPLAAVAGNGSPRSAAESLVKSECGACHMVFPAALLPAASWQKIMATLDNHFGEDASLSPNPRAAIESYLTAHAGRGRIGSAEPPMRITELRWFRGEHRASEVSQLRKQRKLKTLADCTGCHRGAVRGYFEDD